MVASPKNPRRKRPRCVVIAGPNGAGKTTFAEEFLPKYAGIIQFVNADLIAAGLSPFKPGMAAIRAGRLVLSEIDRLATARADFAVESTLSGLSLLVRLKRWKASGYRIEIIYLTLPSVEVAAQRVGQRVRQGGHPVPALDILRRFERSWRNFRDLYRPIADMWAVYDNSGATAQLIETGP